MSRTPEERRAFTRLLQDDEATERALANPCLYCGLDDDEVPYEDTEEHRNTSQHQWAQLDS